MMIRKARFLNNSLIQKFLIPGDFIFNGQSNSLLYYYKEILNDKRSVSNATKHPSHLRKRFTVKLNEQWEETEPELNSLRFEEDDENFLSFNRQSRMYCAFMTKVYANKNKKLEKKEPKTTKSSSSSSHLLCNVITELSDDEGPMYGKGSRWRGLPHTDPKFRKKRKKLFMKFMYESSMKQRDILHDIRFREEEKYEYDRIQEGKLFLENCNFALTEYPEQVEYPQIILVLYRIGLIAGLFEDKTWIYEGYKPFILALMNQIPPELDLLDNNQISQLISSMGRLGPEVLQLKLEHHRTCSTVEEIYDNIINRAFDIIDDLNGNNRCIIMESAANLNKYLSHEKLDILLNDAYPLLKTREGYIVQPRNLVNLIWSMAKHQIGNKYKITYTVCKELTKLKYFGKLQAFDMARAIWALGHLPPMEPAYQEFLNYVTRYFQFNIDVTKRVMNLNHAVDMAEGLSLLEFDEGKKIIMNYLIRDLAKRLTPLSEQQKDVFLDCCIKMGYPITSNNAKTQEKDNKVLIN